MTPHSAPGEGRSAGFDLLDGRSELLGVEPIGLGTPMAEHAASRAARTAWRNGVTPAQALRGVAARVVAELHRDADADPVAVRWIEYLTAEHSYGLYGTSRVAATIVDAFERLTQRGGWRSQTLLDLAAVLAPRQLLEARRRTCWRCVDEWRIAGLPFYEPMLWQFGPVVVCPIHQEPLATACPNPACGRERWSLTGDTVPGYCTHCRTGLWTAPPARSAWSTDTLDWNLWVATELGELVAGLAGLGGPVSPTHMGEATRLAVARTGPSMSAFAAKVGVALSTVSLWKDGRRTPLLALQLRVCRVAGFPVAAFLAGDTDRLRASEPPATTPWLPPRRRPYERRRDVATIEATLRAALTGPPQSMAAVARSLDMDDSYIRLKLPELCAAVTARYYANKRRMARRRRTRQAAAVVRAIRAIQAEGLYPSLYRVRLRVPGSTGRGVVLETWRAELAALGYRR